MAEAGAQPATHPFQDAAILRRQRFLDLLVAMLLGGSAFALYVRTLAPTVLAGDGGEFQFVPYLLGVAHPTGYPLYSLLGWGWSHLLPVGDVAYRMNLFSAFWAALSVGLLYPTTRALLPQTLPALSPGLQRLIASLSALTFALTPTLWSQAVIAEVYGLHIFLVVAFFYFLLLWLERRESRFVLLAAGCFGLGLAHHSTTVLLAPATLCFLWLADRRVFADWRLVLKALLLVLLPLALYLYIPWRAPHTPYLHLALGQSRELVLYENTLANLVRFVLGGPFGGSVDFTVDFGSRLAMTWGFLQDEIGWIGLALALVGVANLALARRWALLALTGLAYLAVVAFNLVYTIGDIYVLYIPSYLVIVLWLSVGVGTLAGLLGRQRVVALLLVLLLFIPSLWLAMKYYPAVDQSQNRSAHRRWQAILAEPLPQDAVLLSNDRNDIMPMWYFQYVAGQRPDLLGLFPLITQDLPALGHVLDLALASGRPVYLIKEMPGIEVKAEVESEGNLWRVTGPAVEGEPAIGRQARLAETVSLLGYDRSPHSPRPGEELLVSLHWEALRPLEAEYHTFVHLLDPNGETVAQSDHQPGGDYYPTTLWRPGERLRDDHSLAIPPDAPPGIYRLLAGMYTLSTEEGLQPLGEPVTLGEVGVKTGISTEPASVAHPTEANFDNQIALLGYDAEVQGETLWVKLHWRSLQPTGADYTIFVHLIDGTGQTLSQHDAQPQDGAYPTSVWDAGEVVVDDHPLPLPPEPSAGDYWLDVGLYLLQTGERLPVEGGGDSVELGPVTLGE